MANIQRPRVFRVSAIQVVFLIFASLMLWFFEPRLAISFAVGGLIAVIPSLYFAAYAFRYSGASATWLIARSFYRGEAGKFTLTLVGFAGVGALFQDVHALALFSSYVFFTIAHIWLTARAVA